MHVPGIAYDREVFGTPPNEKHASKDGLVHGRLQRAAETWRQRVLPASLTVIVPREPQRAVVYILSLGASSRAHVSLSRT